MPRQKSRAVRAAAHGVVVSLGLVAGMLSVPRSSAGDVCAYVTNSGSNSVSVIQVSTRTVIQTIQVGSTPLGIDIAP